eukprot:gene18027-19833_t
MIEKKRKTEKETKDGERNERQRETVLCGPVLLVHAQTCSRGTQFREHVNKYYSTSNETMTEYLVSSMLQCSQKGFTSQTSQQYCIGVNFKTTPENGGKHICRIITTDDPMAMSKSLVLQDLQDWVFLENFMLPEISLHCETKYGSCSEILKHIPASVDGSYSIIVGAKRLQVYCDMLNGGFTLIARFSNLDAKNWMQRSGAWWYDLASAGSDQNSPFIHNSDMLNNAFSVVPGNDIKVTRSDDFKNGAQWSQSYKCLDSCAAVFESGSEQTKGFKFINSQCNTTDDILSRGNIGFWCRYQTGDGAVIMFGGGGQSCSRADHGIGITEMDVPAFGTTDRGYFDFGNDARPPDQAITERYALNLWIR